MAASAAGLCHLGAGRLASTALLGTSPGPGQYNGFQGVSCTGVGNCTAVGYGPGAQPIYAIEVGGNWGDALVVTGSAGGKGYFHAVSCTGAICTAVGSDGGGQPIYSTRAPVSVLRVPTAPRPGSSSGLAAAENVGVPGSSTVVLNGVSVP